jgi:hypothetical protein
VDGKAAAARRWGALAIKADAEFVLFPRCTVCSPPVLARGDRVLAFCDYRRNRDACWMAGASIRDSAPARSDGDGTTPRRGNYGCKPRRWLSGVDGINIRRVIAGHSGYVHVVSHSPVRYFRRSTRFLRRVRFPAAPLLDLSVLTRTPMAILRGQDVGSAPDALNRIGLATLTTLCAPDPHEATALSLLRFGSVGLSWGCW